MFLFLFIYFLKLCTCQTITELTSKHIKSKTKHDIKYYILLRLPVAFIDWLIVKFSILQCCVLVIEKKKVSIIMPTAWILSSSYNCFGGRLPLRFRWGNVTCRYVSTLKFLEEVKRKCNDGNLNSKVSNRISLVLFTRC